MEDWELVLREVYRNDPELARKGSSKINVRDLSRRLSLSDNELALKLAFLREQGLVSKKKTNLELTKRGTHYCAHNTALREVKRGTFVFTTSLLLATFLNFVNWLNITNPWLLLAIFFLGLSVINFVSINSLNN